MYTSFKKDATVHDRLRYANAFRNEFMSNATGVPFYVVSHNANDSYAWLDFVSDDESMGFTLTLMHEQDGSQYCYPVAQTHGFVVDRHVCDTFYYEPKTDTYSVSGDMGEHILCRESLCDALVMLLTDGY